MRKSSNPTESSGSTPNGRKWYITVILYMLCALISATGLHFPIASCIEHRMEQRESEMQIARWWELYNEYTMYADSSVELKFLECLEMNVDFTNDLSDEFEEEQMELLDCIRSRIDELESEGVQ